MITATSGVAPSDLAESAMGNADITANRTSIAAGTSCHTRMTALWYSAFMKSKHSSLTVRLTDELAARLDAEAQARGVSRSDIVRERLESRDVYAAATGYREIADLVGSIDGLPPDVSTKRKDYLKRSGYGRKRPR